MAFEIPAISNYHDHLRQDSLLDITVPQSARQSAYILPMPNLKPSVSDGPTMLSYKEDIDKRLDKMFSRTDNNRPQLVMSIKLLRSTIPEVIQQAATLGCKVVKMYPDDPDSPGITSNTEDGITREIIESLLNGPKTEQDKRFHENLRMIARNDMIFSVHGELPKEEVQNREKAFLIYLKALMGFNKRLRVVMEHITTKEAVSEIWDLSNKFRGRVVGTITGHHLKNTLTDFIGGNLRPHLHCKPMLKFNADRQRLLEAAFSGRKCFFLGPDSAPWVKELKECDGGCSGVWSAPCLIETLFEIFEQHNNLGKIVNFTSKFGDEFYGNPHTERILRLIKQSWVMPDIISGIVPYRAGETIPWRVEGC